MALRTFRGQPSRWRCTPKSHCRARASGRARVSAECRRALARPRSAPNESGSVNSGVPNIARSCGVSGDNARTASLRTSGSLSRSAGGKAGKEYGERYRGSKAQGRRARDGGLGRVDDQAVSAFSAFSRPRRPASIAATKSRSLLRLISIPLNNRCLQPNCRTYLCGTDCRHSGCRKLLRDPDAARGNCDRARRRPPCSFSPACDNSRTARPRLSAL